MNRSLPADRLADPLFREQFWARVDQLAEGCWRWRGTIAGAGRAMIGIGRGTSFYAYRVSYALTYGVDPGGFEVCHRCDNPICVRPDHLFLGTHADNMADARAKQRVPAPPTPLRGEACPHAAGSDAVVAHARAMYATGMHSQAELARHFGVGNTTIGRWVRGDSRTDADGPRTSVGKGRNQTRAFPGIDRSEPCSKDGCDDTARVKGLCRSHYHRAWKDARRAALVGSDAGRSVTT